MARRSTSPTRRPSSCSATSPTGSTVRNRQRCRSRRRSPSDSPREQPVPSLPVGRPSNWEHLDPPTDPEALSVPVLSSDPADEGSAIDAYSGAPLSLESGGGGSV